MTASLTREPTRARALEPPTPSPPPNTTGADRRLVTLFAATSFLGAALLFLVQPMVAKMVLPPFGRRLSVDQVKPMPT